MGRRQPKQKKHEQLSLLYCALSQLSKETVILDAEQGKTSLLYNKSFMDQVYLMARYQPCLFLFFKDQGEVKVH